MNRVMWIGAALLLAACGSEPTDDELAADAWDAISGYESWGQADPWTGIQPSGRAHGAFVQIWFDDVAEGALGGTIPDGGMSVKENYDAADATEPNKVFVMQKIDGYDEANGDWFYARYSPDGSVDVAGQGAITACADCHNTDTGVDRLLSQRDDPATTDE